MDRVVHAEKTGQRFNSHLCWCAYSPSVKAAFVGVLCAVFATAMLLSAFRATDAVAATPTYILLYRSEASTGNAERLVKKARGHVIANYAPIGVVIAGSHSPDFRTRLRELDTSATEAPRLQAISQSPSHPPHVEKKEEKEEMTDEEFEQLKRRLGFPNMADSEFSAKAMLKQSSKGKMTAWHMNLISAPQAHAVTTGSRGVLVGVIDTGIDSTHPNLAPNFDRNSSVSCISGAPDHRPNSWLPGRDSSSIQTHGTHVAGTIAATGPDAVVTGVAPSVRIAAIRVTGNYDWNSPHSSVCAFMWAADRRMDVTNNSWGLDPWTKDDLEGDDQYGSREAVRRAMKYAQDNNVVNVVGIGNDLIDFDKLPPHHAAHLPESAPGVIGVSSVSAHKSKAFTSSYGFSVTTVTAPGADPEVDGSQVLSTIPAHAGAPSWAGMSGTSMATPHVAGVVALIKSVHPEFNVEQVVEKIKSTADNLACPAGGVWDPLGTGRYTAPCIQKGNFNNLYGYGLVNAYRAVTE